MNAIKPSCKVPLKHHCSSGVYDAWQIASVLLHGTPVLQYCNAVLQPGYCTNYGKGPSHVLLSWRNNICWSCPYPFPIPIGWFLSRDHLLASDWSVRCRVSTPSSLTFSGHTPSAHARCLPTLWLKCSIILCTFCSNMTLWNFLTQIRCNLIQIGHAATDISKFGVFCV